MKHILFISPAFANDGVVCKYDKRYIDAWSELATFTIATKKLHNSRQYQYDIIESSDFLSHSIQIIHGRYFDNRELIVPDISRLTIKPFLLRKCREYLKSHTVDAIHTVSFPCSSHLIGYELKREFGLPWIAHFYDPWLDNPLRNIPKRLKAKDISMEALVAEHADAIIHSNTVIRDCWVERYGESIRKKLSIIPFGYSNEQVQTFEQFSGTLPQNEKIIMSYIGTCAGERNFQTLIKAVAKIAPKKNDLASRLEIRLFGNLLSIDKELIDRLSLWSIFNYVGSKPHNQLKKYYQDSDIFLVIDAPQQKNVFFPSKLVDYFYYQRPILGISPQVGVTNQFLKESGNHCFDNANIDGIADYIETILHSRYSLSEYDKEYYKNFLPEEIAKDYRQVINNIVKI